MALDKWIPVFFLLISIVYGYASYTYPLLPFEKNMSFLPNTMPLVLSVLGIILSGILLFSSKVVPSDGSGGDDIDLNRLGDYKLNQGALILAAMIAYALLLRPLGFIPSTILFLIGCSWVLGERKLHIMISVASIGAVSIWYLVQEVLGIFLKPLPWFMG
ncbi:hypothetical protein A9Q83_00415 [Alphaproteobacteria bacterium 46_93_T64]|nr:hypothetical protein A9Q83_00415 [Alphaproteobacteria bacterium 46_93_T64]